MNTKNIIIEWVRKGFFAGIGFSFAIFFSGLMAVSVSGTIHSFSTGEVISASRINENFASLKTAVESAKFGTWELRTNNTNYLAGSDGIVTAYNGGGITIHGYTDSSSSPTTVRIYNQGDASTGNTGLTMPVRKGDYWRVEGATGAVYWIPIGN